MARIRVLKGAKSIACWDYLCDNQVEFMASRVYGTEPPTYHQEWLEFDVEDEAVAVELALRYA